MKILMINGSPNEFGCTYTGLKHIADSLKEEGIESDIIYLGKNEIYDCTACGGCYKSKRCVTKDIVNEVLDKFDNYSGLIIGSPVYYSHPSGRVLSFLNRLFYAGNNFKHKVASSIVSARRAGTTSSLDVINKHFLISGMYVVGSTYWNMVHGNRPEDVVKDLEGLQTMYNLGKNMAYLIKSLENTNIEKPVFKRGNVTNFIR